MYIARLFEVADGNLAYNFATKHYKNQIQDRVYEYPIDINIPVNVLTAKTLINEWQLSQYAQILIVDKGFDDIEYWKTLSFERLTAMNFKEGHAIKFIDKASKL